MKTLKIDVNALMTDVKAIGNIDVPEHGPLCLVSEKNLVNILKTLGTIPAYELAHRIAERLKTKSEARDFNSKMLQEMLMEEMDYIQFAVDCGDLLIGDDSKIKEFVNHES
jgi:hypothetical protein